MSRKGYEVFSSNWKYIDPQHKVNKASKCGIIIINCGWDEVEQNNYGFLSECKITNGKITYYDVHYDEYSGSVCYNESTDHDAYCDESIEEDAYIIYEEKDKERAVKQAQEVLEDLLGIKKFITVHYEHEYEKRTHSFIAECHVDKNDISLYYSLKDGTSLGSSWLIELSLKTAIKYETEEEKRRAIGQAQEILDSYM